MADNNTFDAIKAYLQQTGDNEALKGLEEGAKLAQEQESTKEGVGQTFDIGMREAGDFSKPYKPFDNSIEYDKNINQEIEIPDDGMNDDGADNDGM